LTSYISTNKANPFRYFFLTNKLKEKPQFAASKELREIKEQCKKDKDGNYVLLCYE